MHPSPATIAALLLVLAAAALIAVTAIAVRPAPQGPVATSTQAAPGSEPRVHGRDPSARRTPRRGAGRRTARPAAHSSPAPAAVPAPVVPPEPEAEPAAAPAPEAGPAAPRQEAAVTPPPQAPETVVEAYYRALDAHRFDAAWTILSPAVRAAFGEFERWRDGYATTLSSLPRDIEVAHEGTVASIAHELVTEDRSACGPVRRVFAVRWRLEPAAEGWRATSLTAVKRSGPEPAEACPARHDAARVAGGR